MTLYTYFHTALIWLKRVERSCNNYLSPSPRGFCLRAEDHNQKWSLYSYLNPSSLCLVTHGIAGPFELENEDTVDGGMSESENVTPEVLKEITLPVTVDCVTRTVRNVD